MIEILTAQEATERLRAEGLRISPGYDPGWNPARGISVWRLRYERRQTEVVLHLRAEARSVDSG